MNFSKKSALVSRRASEVSKRLRLKCIAIKTNDGMSKRKPNGITKSDRKARKSDVLLKRDFKADKQFKKAVTDITENKASNGKLYIRNL